MATTTYGSPYVSGTDLVANWPAASLTVANSIDAAGYFIGRGINAQTASYTGILTDAGKTISMTVGSANVFNIPANSSVAYVVGTRINILNLGAGACTVTALAGVTVNGTITALGTNESAIILKTATNTWSYIGVPAATAPGLSLVTPTSVSGTGVSLSGGQVTFTAATTMSINGCFTSTYDNYKVVIAYTTSVNDSTNLRFRTAGTDNTSAVYQLRLVRTTAAGLTDVGLSDQTTALLISANTGGNGISMDILSPNLSKYTICPITSQSSLVAVEALLRFGAISHLSNTSFDGFTLYQSSGNFTGILRVYGYRNS